MAEQPPLLREDEEGFIVGANVLEHAMGMTTDGMGLSLNTEVEPSDDEEEEYIKEIMNDKLDIKDDAVEITEDSLLIPTDDAIDILEEVIDKAKEKNIAEKDDIDEDYEQWLVKQKQQEWSIIYSKKPELIIDRDEYDKILINLLQSYQEFKSAINDMDKLKEIRNENIRDSDGIDNSENRRKIKRKPKKIRKFFHNLFEKIT